MKTKLLTITFFLALTIQSAFTQVLPSAGKITIDTKEMVNNLSLNEFGIIRLKNLNLKYEQDFEEINQAYAYDNNLRTAKLAELNQDYDLNLRAFLRLRSLEAYLAYKANQNKQLALDSE